MAPIRTPSLHQLFETSGGILCHQNHVSWRAHCCILLRIYNISTVQYVNKLGRTRSRTLAEIAKYFCHFCLQHHISVVAEHPPGQNNLIADWNSRYLWDNSDCKFFPQIFHCLQQTWGFCFMDLLVSRLNQQLLIL
mgnify:CR=1 FL=1